MKMEELWELRRLISEASKQSTMVHSMCEGKRGYLSKSEAEITIRKGKPISAFRCIVCRLWHLGTTTTAREQRLVKQRRRERADSTHSSTRW